MIISDVLSALDRFGPAQTGPQPLSVDRYCLHQSAQVTLVEKAQADGSICCRTLASRVQASATGATCCSLSMRFAEGLLTVVRHLEERLGSSSHPSAAPSAQQQMAACPMFKPPVRAHIWFNFDTLKPILAPPPWRLPAVLQGLQGHAQQALQALHAPALPAAVRTGSLGEAPLWC